MRVFLFLAPSRARVAIMIDEPEMRPRHVLCVLGEWADWDEIAEIVTQFPGFSLDSDFSQFRPDDRMQTAFEAADDSLAGSMTAEDWQAIERHTAVAYLLSPPIEKNSAFAISGKTLMLAAGLLQNGALAIKSESSGIAHGAASWLEFAANFVEQAEARDAHGMWATLVQAWVSRPILDEERGLYYSCGLHLLGAADIEIDAELSLDDAVEWIDRLTLYLTADQPRRPIRSGESFRLSEDGPRRILQRLPDKRSQPDEFRFNPNGLLRMEADD